MFAPSQITAGKNCQGEPVNLNSNIWFFGGWAATGLLSCSLNENFNSCAPCKKGRRLGGGPGTTFFGTWFSWDPTWPICTRSFLSCGLIRPCWCIPAARRSHGDTSLLIQISFWGRCWTDNSLLCFAESMKGNASSFKIWSVQLGQSNLIRCELCRIVFYDRGPCSLNGLLKKLKFWNLQSNQMSVGKRLMSQ